MSLFRRKRGPKPFTRAILVMRSGDFHYVSFQTAARWREFYDAFDQRLNKAFVFVRKDGVLYISVPEVESVEAES